MNILVLLTDLFDKVGGIPTFNRALVKALDGIATERDWKVTILVLNDSGTSNLVNSYTTPSRTCYKGFAGSKSNFILSGLQASQDANLVLIGHVHITPIALAMMRSTKMLVVHGIDVWKRLSVLERLEVSRIDQILSVSSFTREQMVKHNRIAWDRFSIFPNTLDPFYGNHRTPRSRQELGLPPGRLILSVSRLDESERYKGIDTIIEALPLVLEELPDAFYVVVGDGADRLRLADKAENNGVRERVFFAGRVPDDLLPYYYQACDVFTLPSIKEGFGIVFLEAMYYAKPCIGVRAGGTPEVIKDGITGILTEPGNIKALADTLVRLLSNEKLRLTMGQAGKTRLEHEFSFGVFRQRLEGILCRKVKGSSTINNTKVKTML